MNGNSASQLAAAVMGSVGGNKVISPIEEAQNELAFVQQTTNTRLEELEDRLKTALRNSVPCIGAEANAKRQEGHSPLHESFLMAIDRQDALNTRLQDYINRLVL